MRQALVRCTLLALAVVAAWPVRADESAQVRELARKLEASLKALEALQRRVDELERRPAAAASTNATAPAAGEWGARLESVERTVAQTQAAAAANAQADTGLPIHGFADVVLATRNQAAAGSAPRGAKLGTFDLYMTPQISSQVKGLIELAFEYDQDGSLATDAERLQLGYVFSDALTLWAGRFHTPYGYWNTAFHHGAQIQTSLSRPRFLEFEDGGGILPAHSVGLWATGALATGIGKINYDVYAVNGNRMNAGVLDYQAAGDSDGNVGLGYRVSAAVGGTGLTLGMHGLTQRVSGSNAALTSSGSSKLQVLGAYATWENDDWELLGEYYAFRNRDLGNPGGGRYSSKTWYAQAAYNLNEHLTLFGRTERADLNQGDPYFALMESARSYRRTMAGFRINVSPKSALKAEWRSGTEEGISGKPATLSVQYSVRF